MVGCAPPPGSAFPIDDAGAADAAAQYDDDLEESSAPLLSSTSGPIRVITANTDSFLKSSTAQASTLPASARCAVSRGTRLTLVAAATPAEAGHYRVRLEGSLPGCALREGYVFGAHFDSVAVVTASADTWLKVSTADSSTLRLEQRCAIARGTTLALTASPRDAGSGHFAVSVEPITGCALRSGYVFGAHFGLRTETPMPPPATSGRRLESVTYRYQYNNSYEPSATCGITSASMLLSAHGVTVTPDGLYTRFGKAQGQSPPGLAELYRAYGLYASSTYAGTLSAIRAHIDAGRPVVVHGNFTRAGHIVVVVGYDDRGLVFHDPSGRWSGVYQGGYPGRTSTNGRFVHYSYGSLERVIGVSGDIWMSVASRTPL